MVFFCFLVFVLFVCFVCCFFVVVVVFCLSFSEGTAFSGSRNLLLADTPTHRCSVDRFA